MPYFLEAITKQGDHVSFVAMDEAEKNKVLAKYQDKGYLKVKSAKVEF